MFNHSLTPRTLVFHSSDAIETAIPSMGQNQFLVGLLRELVDVEQ